MRTNLIILTVLAIVLSSCADLGRNLNGWKLSKECLEFTYDCESQYVTIENGSDDNDFIVNADQDWCTVSTDNYHLFVSVERNATLAVRNAVVTIESGGKKAELKVVQNFDEEASGLSDVVRLPFYDSEASIGKVAGTDAIKLIVDADWLKYRINDREVIVYTDTTYYGREERSTKVIVLNGENRTDIQVYQDANPLDVEVTYVLQPDLTASSHGVMFHLEMSPEAKDIRFTNINEGVDYFTTDDEKVLFELLGLIGDDYAHYQDIGLNYLFQKQLAYRIIYYVLDEDGHNGPLESFYIYPDDFYEGDFAKWIGGWSLSCTAGTGDVSADINILVKEAGVSYMLDGWNMITMAQTGGICVNLDFDQDNSEAIVRGGLISTVEIDGKQGDLYFYPVDSVGDMVECNDGAEIARLKMKDDQNAEIMPSDSSYGGMAFFIKSDGEFEPVVSPMSTWMYPMTLLKKDRNSESVVYTKPFGE